MLLTGLVISLAGWTSVRSELHRRDGARFDRLKERVLVAIDSRFQSTEQALYGGRALIEASGDVPHARAARVW